MLMDRNSGAWTIEQSMETEAKLKSSKFNRAHFHRTVGSTDWFFFTNIAVLLWACQYNMEHIILLSFCIELLSQ